MNTPRLRKVLAVASVAAFVAVATATTSTATTPSAPSASGTHQSKTSARNAGITQPGQAYMGWSKHTSPPSKTPATPPATSAGSASPLLAAGKSHGIDVSYWQGDVDWQGWRNSGTEFAYVKASEGTYYQNEYFGSQYTGSYNVGMIRGAYHFATPNTTDGATQANYFVDSGGGWSADGRTLPGALDIEYNPYGATCYGLSQGDMTNWIGSFTGQYKARTGRDAVIYSTADWWSQCTGDTGAFNTTNPLWVACYCGSVGSIPGGWPYETIWQYSSDANMDKNWFNGDINQVQALANG